MKAKLGVCYYPEHWPERLWAEDAKRMADAGLGIVRIGEFAWSRLEPRRGELQWAWLDLAFKTLSDAGLKILLGTPTATPPRWMLDAYPDMTAVDASGAPRKFGSRRHYCFSHAGYRTEAARIAAQLAERYGREDALCGWQLDNEYGCHDTVLSYSEAALQAFRKWLQDGYRNIAELNQAWGNVFWSMEYDSFSQIELPNLTVTEPNPIHLLDFRRFSSDQVVTFNRAQADAIRAHSRLPLLHNYMGCSTDFDHYQTGADLDIAAWDSYPLGFLHHVSRLRQSAEQFLQQGDPDFQAFHHDLYRSVGRGRWWIAEQQPGPVNWAAYNVAPLPGMVRVWIWEAIAHQAEAVCLFRWRQFAAAQEQMHAGLLRPDSTPAPALAEVTRVAGEVREVGDIEFKRAEVAVLFDYESCWAWETQPQGGNFHYFNLVFDCYRGLRKLGLSVDFIGAGVDSLNPYRLVLIPGLMYWPSNMSRLVEDFDGQLLLGPRAGSKTARFSIPDNPLPPGLDGLDCRVVCAESLPPKITRPARGGGRVHTWMETLETSDEVVEAAEEGRPLLVSRNSVHYLGAWPDETLMLRILQRLCAAASLATTELPEGLRIRETASHRFLFNYCNHVVEFAGASIEPASVSWERLLP